MTEEEFLTAKDRPGRYPVKLESDQSILSAVKWSIREMARGTIPPEQGKGVIDGRERLLRMKKGITPSSQPQSEEDEALVEYQERVKKRESIE